MFVQLKVPTTQDVTLGVAGAIKTALEKLPTDYQPDPSQHIGHVNIGTTHSVVAGQKVLGGPNMAERAESREYVKFLKFTHQILKIRQLTYIPPVHGYCLTKKNLG